MINKKTYRLLHRSRNSRKVAATSRAEAEARADIKEISDHIAEIAKTGDARLILEAELAVLQEERDYLSNSKVQEGSLDTAIEGTMATLDLLEKVRSPESYRTIDEGHVLASAAPAACRLMKPASSSNPITVVC